ncbi:hypothetical protein ACIXN8_07890 [Bacteroides fragilis]
MKDDDVKRYFNELIRLDSSNERYYEIAANRSSNPIQSLGYLSLACERFNNDYYIINSYISVLLDFWEDRIKQEDFQSDAKTIEDNINRSLQLFPYIDNMAFSYRVRYIQLVYDDNRAKLQAELDSICQDVVDKYKLHPQTLYILRLSKSKFLSESLIKKSLEFYLSADNESFIEKIYIELIHWYNSHNEFNKVLETFELFENEYLYSDNYNYLHWGGISINSIKIFLSFFGLSSVLTLVSILGIIGLYNTLKILKIYQKMDLMRKLLILRIKTVNLSDI